MNKPDSKNEPAIGVRSLVVRRGPDVLGLNGMTATVPVGGITVVRGGAGSGKSTFLRTVVGLEQPESGELRILGQTVTRDEKSSSHIRKTVGFVSESLDLFQSMTVLQNLVLAPRLVQKQSAEQIESKAVQLIERLHLKSIVNRQASQLSHGESQSVAIARALMMEPTILLLYEPVTVLDPRLTKEATDLLLEWVFDEKNTLVVATRLGAVPAEWVSKEIVLNEGAVIEETTAEGDTRSTGMKEVQA